jgi:hypothetical protein
MDPEPGRRGNKVKHQLSPVGDHARGLRVKKPTAILTVATMLVATVATSGEFTAAEIARLPQDQVEAAKRECAREWPNDFEMRLYCENKQFRALRELIERGSIKSQGGKL